MSEDLQNEMIVSIPYAMHTHDIEKIIEINDVRKVNERMSEDGWVLLAIVQSAGDIGFNPISGHIQGSEPLYILGIPRTQYCHRCKKAMKWDHKGKKWMCPKEGDPFHRWR